MRLRSPWLDRPAGALLAFGLDAFLAGERSHDVLFTPDERTVLDGYATTRRHIVLETLTDASSALHLLAPDAGGGWSRSPLGEVPPLSTATVTATAPDEEDENAEEVLFDVDGYLQPSTLCRVAADAPQPETLKRAPARFSAEGLCVRQHFAVSADGTRVPYFVVGPEQQEGPAPTLLYGYGGFEVSLTPSYSAVTGRTWLERGGTYAVANIRGGGEYGPAWHRAALGAERDRAFEDFAAVARDLTARGVTVPKRLGVAGGSNGGLLTGVMMLTRCPELFGAVVAEVPLLDMLRFHKLLAGNSWIAEYGDPEDPDERAHLRRWSPYHNLAAGRSYPPLLLTTSTRDDRVHPGHARKMAARMRDLGLPVRYYENRGGGRARGCRRPRAGRLRRGAGPHLPLEGPERPGPGPGLNRTRRLSPDAPGVPRGPCPVRAPRRPTPRTRRGGPGGRYDGRSPSGVRPVGRSPPPAAGGRRRPRRDQDEPAAAQGLVEASAVREAHVGHPAAGEPVGAARRRVAVADAGDPSDDRAAGRADGVEEGGQRAPRAARAQGVFAMASRTIPPLLRSTEVPTGCRSAW